jgi:hypothetical protein
MAAIACPAVDVTLAPGTLPAVKVTLATRALLTMDVSFATGALLTVDIPFAVKVTLATSACFAMEARFRLPVARPVLRGCWPCLWLRPCLWLVSRSYRSRACRMSSLFCRAKP